MSVNVESLNIQLTSDAEKASSGFSKLVKTLKEFKEAIRNSDATKISASMSELASTAESVSKSSNSISKLSKALRSMKDLGEMKHLHDIAGGIRSISRAINGVSFGKLKEFNSVFKSTRTIKQLSGLNSAKSEAPNLSEAQTIDASQEVKSFSSISNQVSGSILSKIGLMTRMFKVGASGIGEWSKGFAQLNGMSGAFLGKLGLIIGGVFAIGRTVKKQVEKFYRFVARTLNLIPMSVMGIKKGFISLRKTFFSVRDTLAGIPGTIISKMFPAFRGLFDTITNFWNSIKRVALYRLIRTLLKHITTAVKEGVENLYQYSKLFEGTFSRSLDRVSTSFLYLKNSIGAVVSPLINELAPAIDFVVDRLVDLINWFNRAMATLTGASSWTKALRYPKEFAESASGAGKALKDLKFLIAGFDELNVLPSNNTGGGSASTPDYSKMFEEQPLKKIDFFEKIREKFLEGDWEGLGKEVAYKFDEIVKKFPAQEIGEKLGGKLNNVVGTAKSSFNTSALKGTFYELGAKTSEGIAGFDEAFNYQNFSDTVSGFWNSIFNTVYGFAKKFPWTSIGKNWGSGFNKMFQDVEWDTIADTASTSINGVFTTIKNFIENFNLSEHVRKFTEALNKMVKDTDWVLIGDTINAGFRWILDGAVEFVKTFDWSEFGQSVADMLERIEWDDIFGKAREFGNGIVDGALTLGQKLRSPIGKLVNSFVSNLRQFFNDNKDKIKEAFKILFGDIDWGEIAALMFDVNWEIFKVKVGMFFHGLGALISGGFKFIGDKFKGFADWLAGGDAAQTIHENYETVIGGEIDFSSYWGDQKEVTTPKFSEEEIKKGREAVASVWKWFEKRSKNLFEGIKTSADAIFPGISDTINSAFEWAKDTSIPLVESLASSTKTAFEGMGTSAAGWNSTVVTAFDGVNTSASTIFPSIFEKIKSVFSSDEGSAITNAKTSTEVWKKDSIGYFDEIHSSVNTVFPDVKNKITGSFFESVGSALKEISQLSSGSKSNFESIQTKVNTVFPEILRRIKDTFQGAKDSAVRDSEEMARKTTGFFGSVFSKLSDFMQKVREAKQSASELQSMNAVHIKTSVHTTAPRVKMRAAGGLPNVGEMFIAREAGPELVGRIGSQSAVVNNEQIVLSVARGVAAAVANVIPRGGGSESFKNSIREVVGEYIEPLLKEIANDTKRQADKKEQTVVQVGGRTVTDAVVAQRNANGYSFV